MTRRTACLLAVVGLWLPASVSLCAQETRIIPLGVFSQDGKPLLGLTAEQISVRGLEADWKLTYDNDPHRIAILLDLSGSMGRPGKWQRAREFITALIQSASPGEAVGLYAFAQRFEELVPFTEDLATIRASVDSLPPPGSKDAKTRFGVGTAFGGALAFLRQTPLGFGDAIILVADFIGPDASREKAKTHLADLNHRGIRVFHFLIREPEATSFPPWIEEDFYREMADLVEGTGGMAVTPWVSRVETAAGGFRYIDRDAETLAAAAHLLVKHIYRLEVHLRGPLRKKATLRIEIVDKEIKTQHKPWLLYPRVMFPHQSSE